jgi:hypothetical protein
VHLRDARQLFELDPICRVDVPLGLASRGNSLREALCKRYMAPCGGRHLPHELEQVRKDLLQEASARRACRAESWKAGTWEVHDLPS